MKRIECKGVGDNDGFFEIGVEVGVSETAGCSTATLAEMLSPSAKAALKNRIIAIQEKVHTTRYGDYCRELNKLYEELSR